MKFTLFLLCFTVFFINTLSKKIRKNHSTIESIAYALGKTNTDQFYLNNKSKYRSVPYVDKLPQQGTPISDGLIETVDVIETDSNYYDGTIGLKTTTITRNCASFTYQPQMCLKQSSCGWCGSSNTCINGNNLGPLTPCIKNTYIFTSPSINWNPLLQGNVTNVKN